MLNLLNQCGVTVPRHFLLII